MPKKRTEVTLRGLSKEILVQLTQASNNYSKHLTQDKSSPFSSIDENILFTEFLMLSLWNLMTLFPQEIYDNVLRTYLEALEQENHDKTAYSKLLEYRRMQYTCSWAASGKNLPSIESVFLQNIDEKLMSDNKAHQFAATFLSQINGANSGLLELIKSEMQIV